MINNDTGCDWNFDVIKTYWTGVRAYNDALDGPMMGLDGPKALLAPYHCKPVAPACPNCTLDW